MGPRASVDNFVEQKNVLPTEIRTPDRPARSLVSVPSTRSRLKFCRFTLLSAVPLNRAMQVSCSVLKRFSLLTGLLTIEFSSRLRFDICVIH